MLSPLFLVLSSLINGDTPSLTSSLFPVVYLWPSHFRSDNLISAQAVVINPGYLGFSTQA